MSDHDRGAYAPESDAPLAFDPRQARGGGPAPFSLIVSVMVLLVLIGGAYLFYRHGVRKSGETPQVLGASIGQTRTPPAGAGQS
ncbi:MAG TPA: SPOR domain-containing protein, partial [Caulobacteraceae bacterium]|nr:SPOR domain-containing protein [Caulobacteraceae bacterium]